MRRRQRLVAGPVVLFGGLEHGVPDHVVVDAEGLEEILERDAATGAQRRVPGDERELARQRGSTAAQHGTQEVVMLADVPPDVLEQIRVGIAVGRDA